MTDKVAVEIVMVSGTCCMSHLAKADAALEKVLQQAANELGADVNIRKVSLSAVLAGSDNLATTQRQQILSLFQRYNTRFTPAVMINDQVRFAGLLPTVQQLKEVLQVVPSSQS